MEYCGSLSINTSNKSEATAEFMKQERVINIAYESPTN